MDIWQKVWRDGLAPQLSTAGLTALRQALQRDDPRLVQGATTVPPPLECLRDFPVEATCPTGFCGWHGAGLQTVSEVEEFFARVCHAADNRLGEPAAMRYFLNWWDDTPRAEARRLLLAEVSRALGERGVIEEPGNEAA
jgi:hypothetical protein